MERSCIMFNCLWQLWDWLDPPVLTSSASMEGKKMAPPPQQAVRPHHPQAHQTIQGDPQLQPLYTSNAQHHYIQQQQHHNNSNAVVHQPPRPPHPQSMGARSPLLENHQEVYGTRQPTELARQYAIREQQLANQRLEQRSMPMGNSSYSIQSPSQDPILSVPIPPGYNASVHQAYLRRNQHQLDHQQIYQNHQSLYQAPIDQPRLYQPYTSRLPQSQSNYASNSHSHTNILRQQYNELQQMKLQQQMQYQSQAQIHQQQTFAQRQILNQHLHSRQQSHQNIAQYGTSPSTAQLNEVNARLSKRQDNLSPTSDDYGTHPIKPNNQVQNNNTSSPTSKSSGELVSSPSIKSPSGSDSRRSSSGTSQALRSPIAQRPVSAPVTKAGWLYKQGSDGLKVWRKRWFVLSEYCLFYYKGQEEDKLLGSVLLPSYQVSLCTGDEKNPRKYSFKCEHANMRTYVLAAPDQTSMDDWVRVLTMAATMQDISASSKLQIQVNPAHQQSIYDTRQIKNSGEQDIPNTEGNVIVQHMYENAPPKPRRSNEGYHSPNLDRTERYDPNYDILREPTYGSSENAQQKAMKSIVNNKLASHNNSTGIESIYESKSNNSNYAQQRHLAKSPEAIYNSHNLSLPLTNTHSNRLDNNKSPLTLTNSLPNRTPHNDNRNINNKSPSYFENKTLSQDNLQKQTYQMDNQNVYGESSYQKMLQQQEMNKRILEREQQYLKEQGNINPAYQQARVNRPNGTERQSFERRTPDTYGRSVIVPGYYNKGRSSDYEDVYAAKAYGETSYTRPMSPTAYGDNINVNPIPNQRYDQNQLYQQAPSVQLRQKKIPHDYTAPGLTHNTVPRPHSADFLEYESKNPMLNANNVYNRNTNQNSRQQPPRPKSSLDINSYDYNGDSYYYSEARYAEKMRQSAHYLRSRNSSSNVMTSRTNDPRTPDFTSERKLSMPSFRTSDGTYDSEIRESIYGIQDQNRNISGVEKYSEITGPNSNWTLKNKSLSQIMSQDDVYNRSNSAMSEGSTVSGYNRDSLQMGSGSGDQFMRSASARLPSVGSDQLPYRDGEKKVQQREESMKRLLEWKQRMLQSPLTRKPTPATLSLVRSLPPGPSQRQTLPKASARLNQIQSSYNSYSSDDEERLGDDIGAADNVESQPRQGQAGRSPNTPTISPNTPPSITTSQSLGNPPLPKLKQSPDQHTQVPDLNISNTSSNQSEKSINKIDNEKSVDVTQLESDDESDTGSDELLEYTDNDLDEILAQSDNDDSKNDSASGRKSVINFHIQLNENSFSSTKDNPNNSQRFHDYEICEIKQEPGAKERDEVENKDAEQRNDTESPSQETPPNGEICEDHYLPMSPRKAVLSPEPAHTEIIKNINVFVRGQTVEDNPYVEMSQGIGVESAFQNEEMQAYEVVCVSNSTVEPVYQELANLPERNILDEKNAADGSDKNASSNDLAAISHPKSILRKQISESKLIVKSSSRNDVKSPLPDILMNSQSKSSIMSSDAEDETSKEYAMDRAFSRFSLSDNFRPASYYLNSSGIPADIQDSSDSELVSPPPIPTSPPPMEELESSYTPMTRKIPLVSTSPTIKRTVEKKSVLMDYGNTPSMYDTIFKGERIKRNRASLPDDKKFKDTRQSLGTKRTSLDTKLVPPTYKTSRNNDNDSLLSYNADRGSSRLSLESDFSSKLDMSISSSSFNIDDRHSLSIPSDKTSINDENEFVELRHSNIASDIDRMMKRRPLSEESFMEIESLDSNFHDNADDINLDQYLDELQASNVYLYSNNVYPTLKPLTGTHDPRHLDMAAVGYLNERVAAIREEVQYENLHLMESGGERSRSRNSTMSNTNSDPDTVNTFQTVRSHSRMSNLSGLSGTSQIHHKSASNLSVRSASRNSLPIESNINTSPLNRTNHNHTRHSSIEQPTISYYSKTTPYFENEASILKNLNPSLSQDQIASKVNISDMTTKSPKPVVETQQPAVQDMQLRVVKPSHSRDSSLEQSAPYYYSDISSQDNLNVSVSSSISYSPLFSKNNMNFQSKLNNQRRKGPSGKKCDISHIHNPIRSNLNHQQTSDPEEGPLRLAAVARCVSVEFLSATDKYSDIDDKNIYESHAMKTQKVKESMPSSTTSKNIYLSNHDKTSTSEGAMSLFAQSFNDCPDERKRSIERILHNVVKSGSEIRTNELSRSRSQSALMDIENIRSPTMITNILTESYTQQTSTVNVVKPVNSNLYVETGTFSSNNQGDSDSDTYARIADEYNFNGEMMWEEDTIWSENLRRVSQRHARSLDRLDCLASPSGASGRRSVDLKTMLKSSTEDTESNALYVNGRVSGHRSAASKRRPYNKRMSKKSLQPLQPVDQSNENDVYVQLAADALPDVNMENDDGVYEQLTTESLKSTNNEETDPLNVEKQDGEVRRRFEIDRENIRQWDLMSSGLMKGGEGFGGREGEGEGEGTSNTNTISTTASMSASLTGAENIVTKRQPLVNSTTNGRSNAIPIRAVSPRVRQPEQSSWQMTDTDTQWASQNMTQNRTDDNWNTARSPSRQSAHQPIRAVSPRVRRASEVDDRPPPPPVPPPPDTPPPPQTLSTSLPDLSAGELLGRTHEELVLLLIQLRRRHAATAGAIEQCCTQMHNLQSHINSDEVPDKHQENLNRLEALRNHLADLERHYTKSKPLVHLVDNMVKLGSLYNKSPSTLERLEYNQMAREKALLDEAQEQKRWNGSSEKLSRSQVEQRVEQLRAMERNVAGEAKELRELRQEREALHRAFDGNHLQHDLSRVHAMLAINSKKLEQTVAGNARLEQELAVLRQKLQQNNSRQDLGDEDGTNAKTAADATALLEDELKRVQQLVSDLQKQRQELSVAVRQLTDKSQTLGLVGQNRSVQTSSELLNDCSSQAYKKRSSPPWVETDLDGELLEHGSTSPVNLTKPNSSIYAEINFEQRVPSPDHSDDQGLSSAFANLSSVEKQEIKTVRIVKRESERRQRDRERSLQPGNSEWSNHHAASTLDQLLEEDSLNSYGSGRDTTSSRSYQTPQYNTYNSNSYQADNTSTKYSYPKANTSSSYQPRTHNINPPNTLSLTNVNNPFENYSTSNSNLNNKYVSSPSLTNNNDYYQDNLTMTMGKYNTYQSSAAILPLPVSSSYSSTLSNSNSKQSFSQSASYLDGSTTDVRSTTTYSNGILSPTLSKTASITSLTKTNAELSPVFTSEAARQIIFEMAGEKNGVVKSNGSQHRRQVPKEKRRHNTAPHHLSAKDLDQINGDDFSYQEKWYRARDDVDMERVLRGSSRTTPRGPPPLAAPPDVVRSTLPAPHTEHYTEHTIDRLLAAPNKIVIPERYIPEQAPELSPEEQQRRQEKVESIKKMLSSTTPSGDPSKSPDDNDKRQREHLLQLNQILAKQVMEMSKIVAVKASQAQPAEDDDYDSEDRSPDVELPIYQQRDNFFT